MAQIIDSLFIKRFCLPSNVNLYDYENGTCKVEGCLCGEYNHAACIIKGKCQ